MMNCCGGLISFCRCCWYNPATILLNLNPCHDPFLRKDPKLNGPKWPFGATPLVAFLSFP
jgi:hypothetical protein